MEKVIVIVDNFQLIHIGHQQLLESIKLKMDTYGIDKCIIFIADEEGDVLGYMEKEALLDVLIRGDEKIEIFQVPNLKIFKEIKKLEQDGMDVVAVYTEPNQSSYVSASINGLPTELRTYVHNINTQEIEEYIIKGMYQEYCKFMPTSLWAEFQNLKEIYNMNKLTESMENQMTVKINKTELESYLGDIIDKHITQIEESKSKEMILTKSELKSIVEDIIVEKLKGQEYDSMHDLKMRILRGLNKISKSKWLLTVSNVGKRNDGNYVIKLTGSGNTVLSIFWGEDVEGDFLFSTTISLIAGDIYSTKMYRFMMMLIDKQDYVSELLKSTEETLYEMNNKGPIEDKDKVENVDIPENPEINIEDEDMDV